MTVEIIDTSSNYPDKEIMDGPHQFEVGIVTKKDIKGKTGYEWQLNYEGGVVQILLWPNVMGSLLRVLGVKEESPNKFVFDPILVEGKKFKATAYKDKKGYQQLKDYSAVEETADVPF